MTKVVPEEFEDMLKVENLQPLVAALKNVAPELKEETAIELLYFTETTKNHVMKLIEHNQLFREKFRELLNAKNN